MWRRVASQSPLKEHDPNREYIKSYAALNQLLREGRSLSGGEKNCCFLNTTGSRFATVSSASGINYPDDGRAFAAVDWDFDGDLDLWSANRTAPRMRFLRNDAPKGDHGFLALRLSGDGKTTNRDAIGARVEVYSKSSKAAGSVARKQIRTLHAGEGFLSQSTNWLHVGLGTDDVVEKVVVRWPGGGEGAKTETFTGLSASKFYKLAQHSGKADAWQPPKRDIAAWEPSLPTPHPPSNQGRVVLVGQLPLPKIDKRPIMNADKSAAGPKLLNLWSTSCRPCLTELKEFADQQAKIDAAGLTIEALNVDELMENPQSDLSKSRAILEHLKFPYAATAALPEAVGILDVFQRAYFSIRRPLPAPSSFLLTRDGHLAVVYRGPVSVEQVLKDMEILDNAPEFHRSAAAPFPGKWHELVAPASPRPQVLAYIREGYVTGAQHYLQDYLEGHLNGSYRYPPGTRSLSTSQLTALCDLLADCHRIQWVQAMASKDAAEAKARTASMKAAYEMALQFAPRDFTANNRLGVLLCAEQEFSKGIEHLARAYEANPKLLELQIDLAEGLGMAGRHPEAISHCRQILQKAPNHPEALRILRAIQQSTTPPTGGS